MEPFSYSKPTDDAHAIVAGGAGRTSYIAGGTTLVDLMRLGVMRPSSVVDVNGLAHAQIVAAYAAGTILNPKTARSQFIGGIVWSIGMALMEEGARDLRSARLMTSDLADYHVPVNADVPDIDVIMVDEVDAHVNEIGAKGIGEIGNTGTNAAIANAVFHATGKRIRDLPIRLDKLISEDRA